MSATPSWTTAGNSITLNGNPSGIDGGLGQADGPGATKRQQTEQRDQCRLNHCLRLTVNRRHR
jgi:hypothetical protein